MPPLGPPKRHQPFLRSGQGASAAQSPDAQAWFALPAAADVMEHLPLGPRSLATLAATFPHLRLQAPLAAPVRAVRPWGPPDTAAVPLHAARHFTALLQAIKRGELDELGLVPEDLSQWSTYAASPEAAQWVLYKLTELPEIKQTLPFVRAAVRQLFAAWLAQSIRPDFVDAGPPSFVRLDAWLRKLIERHETPKVQQALLTELRDVGLACGHVASQRRVFVLLLGFGVFGMRLHPATLSSLKFGLDTDFFRQLPQWRMHFKSLLARCTQSDRFWRPSSETSAEPWLNNPATALDRATNLLDILQPDDPSARIELYTRLIGEIERRQVREPAMLMGLCARMAQTASRGGADGPLYAECQATLGQLATASELADTARAAAHALRFFGQPPQSQTVSLLLRVAQRPQLSPVVLEAAIDSLAMLSRQNSARLSPALAAMFHLLQLGEQKYLGEAAYRGLMDLRDERWLRTP